jgi:purine nucleosidase
VFVMQFKF